MTEKRLSAGEEETAPSWPFDTLVSSNLGKSVRMNFFIHSGKYGCFFKNGFLSFFDALLGRSFSSKKVLLAGLGVVSLAGCVSSYQGPTASPTSDSALATQDQMAQTEEQDRLQRFQRLATEKGIVPPVVSRTMLPPGSVDFMKGSVPVVRVVFPEKAFFAFGSAEPLPESQKILDIVADNMKHDVPDAALTVLGHTDAIGSDTYNMDLSRRRAAAVISALVARGVPASEMTNVAIGKNQPIAPNDNEKGRALNRRVEFVISPAQSANLAAVQQVVVPKDFLKLSKNDGGPVATSQPAVLVYKVPQNIGLRNMVASKSDMTPIGGLQLSQPSSEHVSMETPPDQKTAILQSQERHYLQLSKPKPVTLLRLNAPVLATLTDRKVYR